MSTENILNFIQAMKTNPELKAKVLGIPEGDAAEVARQAAVIAGEYGYVVTAEELIGVYQEVSDEELEGIAGGKHHETDAEKEERIANPKPSPSAEYSNRSFFAKLWPF